MQRLEQGVAAAACLALSISCASPHPPTVPTVGVSAFSAPFVVSEVTGRGTFTFSIDSACSSQFPEAVRQRTYSVASPGYSAPYVVLGGAVFERSAVDWNVVYRSTGESSSAWYFNDPPIWERLSDEAYLEIYGGSEYGSVSEYGEWSAFGRVRYCASRKPDTSPSCAVPEISCTSTRHRLRLTRD
jgi:hypothetical protein